MNGMGEQDQIDRRTGRRSQGSGAGCWLPRWAVGGVVFLMGTALFPLRAQTNTAQADANRCLLIVDTSRAMERRSEATLRVVHDLVTSGLNGQLRPGDTLGLWTFNQELYAGRLPLQVWSPEVRERIASRTIAFLRTQEYSKRPSFDRVLPALDRVVKNSERITVVLISSGDERIQDTPFENEIMDYYRRGRSQQRKAQMPFVTILRAQNGRLTDYTLNMPPQPLQFPPLPEVPREIVQGKPSDPGRPADTESAAFPSQVRERSRPVEASAAKPKPEPAEAEAPVPPATGADAGKSAAIKLYQTSTIPAKVEKVEPAPALARAPEPAPPPPKVEAPPPIAEPEAAPVSAKPEAVISLPAASQTPKPDADVSPKPAPPPPPLAIEAGLTSALATATGVVSSPPPTQADSSSPTAAVPVVQTATAAPAAPLAAHKSLWIAALVLALITVGMVVVLLQRSRSTPQGSLITRSIERRKKP